MGIVQQLIPLARERDAKNWQSPAGNAGCRRLKGYTLIEVMISVTVVAVAFVGFYLCLSQGFVTTEVSREDLRATQLLQQQMETIRLYTWDQVNSNGFIPATFTAPFNAVGTSSTNGPVYTGTITIGSAPMTESYASNHVLVTVVLTWNSGKSNQQHSRQMSTIVSQYGLHNYFY